MPDKNNKDSSASWLCPRGSEQTDEDDDEDDNDDDDVR